MDRRRRSEAKPTWRVDETATTDELMADGSAPLSPPAAGGRVVYIDENGLRRHLPADLGSLSSAQREAALEAMSRTLGAGPQDLARRIAIKRLTELHAAGRMSDEQYRRERRRLEGH